MLDWVGSCELKRCILDAQERFLFTERSLKAQVPDPGFELPPHICPGLGARVRKTTTLTEERLLISSLVEPGKLIKCAGPSLFRDQGWKPLPYSQICILALLQSPHIL